MDLSPWARGFQCRAQSLKRQSKNEYQSQYQTRSPRLGRCFFSQENPRDRVCGNASRENLQANVCRRNAGYVDSTPFAARPTGRPMRARRRRLQRIRRAERKWFQAIPKRVKTVIMTNLLIALDEAWEDNTYIVLRTFDHLGAQ